MLVRGQDLDINILEELEEFNWLENRVRGDKFQACSPFRDEKHPSFAVNLENGTWKDSGAVDMNILKGNLIQLLALLRNEEYEDTESYLLEKYGQLLEDTEALQLHLDLHGEQDKPRFFSSKEKANLFTESTDYLSKRGISKEIQILFRCGYDPVKKAVALVWTNSKGQCINIKYRSVIDKKFWYEKDGQRITNFLFGLYQCILKQAKRIYICESEIDALTLWTYGYYAVAVGGSSFSESQKNMLLKTGVEDIVIATDNDAVGNRFREQLKESLAGEVELYSYKFPDRAVKDINELTVEELKTVEENIFKINLNFLLTNAE